MKARLGPTLLAAAALLVLAGVYRYGRIGVRSPEPQTVIRSIERPSMSVDRSKQVEADELGTPATAHGQESSRSARGAGYVWGRALKQLFAPSTLTPEGKRHLDLTELEKSFRKVERPVDLEDGSALTQARAEYLASVITAAMDLTSEDQAELAAVLQGYYNADFETRGLSQAEQTKERARLSSAAREEIAKLLPSESQDAFREIFASTDFLFRSMSLASDEITLTTRGGTVMATGGVVFTVDPGGALEFQAEGMVSLAEQKATK